MYLENCERRIQAMRTIRSISNAGLDWFKNVRRNSKYEIDNIRRMSTHDEQAEPQSKPNIDQNETTYERL